MWYLYSLLKSALWSTTSKAFLVSREQTRVSRSRSEFSEMVSVMSRDAKYGEDPGEKPNWRGLWEALRASEMVLRAARSRMLPKVLDISIPL